MKRFENRSISQERWMKSLLALVMAVFMGSVASHAQEAEETDHKVMTQKQYPEGFDNRSFGVFYYNNDGIYTTLRHGYEVIKTDGKVITNLKVNPSGATIASIERSKKGDTQVSVYDLSSSDTRSLLERFKVKGINMTAIAYSADAKQFAVASTDKHITLYSSVKSKKQAPVTWTSELVPSKLVYSDNNYFLAATDGKRIEIWNIERGTVRKTLEFDSFINDIVFASGSSRLIVATSDGKLTIYDTAGFNQQASVDDLGNAMACYPNTDGKYIAVLNSENRICVVNLLDPTERHFIDDELGKMTDLRVIYNNVDSQTYVLYNNANAIVYHKLDHLTPYYNKMMTSLLTEKLNQWMKQMPEESLEAYHQRVNDSTYANQAKLFEREIATSMATGLLEEAEITIGDYNTNSKNLALHFNSMPNIYLNVPLEEVKDFDNAAKLEFRNVKYGLNPDDKFELVYAEVYNPSNGKTYVFDNLQRASLAYMQEDTNYVPLDIIQKSNMEETALESLKEDIISMAQQDQVISDKTRISVSTNAESTVDADGKKIVNYNVDFTYEVEEEFSARDDFKPGRYHTNESNAAMLMLKVMQKAFETDFAKYLAEGKRVMIKIKGTADASPIARALPYDGQYGEYDGEPVYKDAELSNITLNKKEGIATNEQLAFARAIGVQHYIEQEVTALAKMNHEYEYHIEVSKEAGSKFRRINVQYVFFDAF